MPEQHAGKDYATTGRKHVSSGDRAAGMSGCRPRSPARGKRKGTALHTSIFYYSLSLYNSSVSYLLLSIVV